MSQIGHFKVLGGTCPGGKCPWGVHVQGGCACHHIGVYIICMMVSPPIYFLDLRIEHGGLLPFWESCNIIFQSCKI